MRRAYDETEHRRVARPASKGELDLWADIFVEDAESKHRVVEEHGVTPASDTRVSASGIVRPAKRGRRHPSVPREFTAVPDDAPGWARGWASITEEQRSAQRDRWREQLLPIVRELAEVSGAVGFMPCDVISRGITTGVLLGEWFVQRHPRVYSWSGSYLARLARQGLIAPLMDQLTTGQWVHRAGKSDRLASHGNEGSMFVHPRFARHLADGVAA